MMTSPLSASPQQRPAVLFASTKAERDQASKSTPTAIPDMRLMGKIAFNADSHRHNVPAIVWDTPSKHFFIRVDRMNDSQPVRWDSNQSYERELPHNMVLGEDFIGGTIVDQTNGRLHFPDGRWMDGATGDMYTPQGVTVASLTGGKPC